MFFLVLLATTVLVVVSRFTFMLTAVVLLVGFLSLNDNDMKLVNILD